MVLIAGIGAAIFLFSLSVGLPISHTLSALFGHGDPYANFVVRTLRLPRAIAAVAVGAALGMSGGLLQGVVRNPLASPDIVGVTAGASAAAVVAVMWLDAGTYETELAAFVGALAAAGLTLLLARGAALGAYAVPLVGIGISAIFMALTNYMLTRAQVSDTRRAFVWLVGSLDTQTWNQARDAGAAVLALAPVAFLLERQLRVLQLGPTTARSLGVAVARSNFVLIALAALLAAVATATAGPVAFVALVSPHLARLVFRRPFAPLLAMGLLGAVLVLGADAVAERALWTRVPVGVVTPLLGAPYLLWLLQRSGRVSAR